MRAWPFVLGWALAAGCGESSMETPPSVAAPSAQEAVAPDPEPEASPELAPEAPDPEETAEAAPDPTSLLGQLGVQSASTGLAGAFGRTCPAERAAPAGTCPGTERAPRALRRELTRLLRRTASAHSFVTSESADTVRAIGIDAWITASDEGSRTVSVAYTARTGGYNDTRGNPHAAQPPDTRTEHCIRLRLQAEDGEFAFDPLPCLPSLGQAPERLRPRRLRL